jgi:predicted NBD/HSP70 family sugar kinase
MKKEDMKLVTRAFDEGGNIIESRTVKMPARTYDQVLQELADTTDRTSDHYKELQKEAIRLMKDYKTQLL